MVCCTCTEVLSASGEGIRGPAMEADFVFPWINFCILVLYQVHIFPIQKKRSINILHARYLCQEAVTFGPCINRMHHS